MVGGVWGEISQQNAAEEQTNNMMLLEYVSRCAGSNTNTAYQVLLMRPGSGLAPAASSALIRSGWDKYSVPKVCHLHTELNPL